MGKCKDSVENSPHQGQKEAKQNDKGVVGNQLGVMVGCTDGDIDVAHTLCAGVLRKAVTKVKL